MAFEVSLRKSYIYIYDIFVVVYVHAYDNEIIDISFVQYSGFVQYSLVLCLHSQIGRFQFINNSGKACWDWSRALITGENIKPFHSSSGQFQLFKMPYCIPRHSETTTLFKQCRKAYSRASSNTISFNKRLENWHIRQTNGSWSFKNSTKTHEPSKLYITQMSQIC